MKIKTNSILLFLVCLLTLYIPYISQRANNFLILCIECFLFFLLIFSKENYLGDNKSIFLFMITIIVSTFFNVHFGSRFLTSIIVGAKYYLIFITISYVIKNSNSKKVINYLFIFYLLLLIIIDLIIIFTRGNGIGMDGILGLYLVGNKFTVSYLHMFLLSLIFIQDIIPLKKGVYYLFALFSIFILHMIDCNTGIIGIFTIVLANFILKIKPLNKLMRSPFIYIISMLVLTTFIINIDYFTNLDIVVYLIRDVFHRSLTLTGRLQMFNIALDAVMIKPLLGYGINCTIIEDTLMWGNAQNGLLKMLLDHGVLGVLCFFIVIFSSFNNNKVKNDSILTFLYGMAICTIVEINLGALFFLGLALYKFYTEGGDKNEKNRNNDNA